MEKKFDYSIKFWKIINMQLKLEYKSFVVTFRNTFQKKFSHKILKHKTLIFYGFRYIKLISKY